MIFGDSGKNKAVLQLAGFENIIFGSSADVKENPMALPARKSEAEKHTYADYLTWPDDERCELIDGQTYAMSPAPGTAHQEVLLKLASKIQAFMGKGPCQVFVAPFDVRLAEADEDTRSCSNVLQPDISVICDPDKLDEKGCIGAPDWVIEILSPSTSSKDQIKKRYLYEKHGVKEFWLIHPTERTATLYYLKGASYALKGIYDDTATLKSHEFKGFSVRFKEILPVIRAVKERICPYCAKRYKQPEEQKQTAHSKGKARK